MPKKKVDASKVSPKEASLILIINVLNNCVTNVTRENFIAAMHDLGFPQFNIRTGGFDNILENFETNKERALTRAVNLLEQRGFDIEKIKNLDFGLFSEAEEIDADEEEEEEEEKPAKKSKKPAPVKKGKSGKKGKK